MLCLAAVVPAGVPPMDNQPEPVVAALAKKKWDVQIRPAENYWRRLDKLVRIRTPCTCCNWKMSRCWHTHTHQLLLRMTVNRAPVAP
jgi:hypothetical protein